MLHLVPARLPSGLSFLPVLSCPSSGPPYTRYVFPGGRLVPCSHFGRYRPADLRCRTHALSFLARGRSLFSLQWSTTWDRSDLFTYTNLSPNPIDFVTPGATGSADIVVNDGTVYQDMIGFGASLSEFNLSFVVHEVHQFLTISAHCFSRRLSTGFERIKGAVQRCLMIIGNMQPTHLA